MSLWRSVQSKTPSLSLASTATIPSISATISPPTGTASDETHTSHSVPDMLTSKLLMPSFIFTYLCMGEFAGFVVGWNLLLEQIIGVALVAKGIASYFDVLIFDGVQVNITQVQPITSNISEYFDFFAFFIPILIAGKSKRAHSLCCFDGTSFSTHNVFQCFKGPLLLILRRSTILSVVSVVSSISVVVFILILGAINGECRALPLSSPTQLNYSILFWQLTLPIGPPIPPVTYRRTPLNTSAMAAFFHMEWAVCFAALLLFSSCSLALMRWPIIRWIGMHRKSIKLSIFKEP